MLVCRVLCVCMHAVHALVCRGARKSIHFHTFWCDRAVVLHAVYACMPEMCERTRKSSTPFTIPVCVRAIPHAPSCTAGGRRKGSFHASHSSTSSLVILSVFCAPHLPLPVHLFSSVVHWHFSRTHLQMHTISVTKMHQQIDTWNHM